MTDDDHIRYMLDGGTRGQIERLIESKDTIGFGGGLWLHAELPAFKEDVGRPGPMRLGELRRRSEFYKQRFELDTGAAGFAVWFRRGSDPLRPRRDDDRTLCGWVPLAREAEVTAWLERLNTLIQTNLDRIGSPSAEQELEAAAAAHAQRGAMTRVAAWRASVRVSGS